MPFIIGPAPVRHTLQYLQKGRIMLKDRVKILTINYNHKGEQHKGARDFVFWHLGQLQYKNPQVQIAVLKNMTPTPFIRCWLDDMSDVIMDVDGKSKEEILNHLNKILGKPPDVLAEEEKQKQKIDNPANFGKGCEKNCICEIPGQIPCPAILPLPNHMRGKYIYQKTEE